MTHPHTLFAALGAIPRLPGARCRGQHNIFDPRDQNDPHRDQAETLALDECRRCPALAGCEAWYDNLPPRHRPYGVIAGRVNPLTRSGQGTRSDHD